MIEDKIKKLYELKVILDNLKEKELKIVFTNGCFDILHYGHVKYLETAKENGDILVVAVNSDSSVKKIKGAKRPISPQYSRARLIAALESVDFVVLFNEETPLETIKLLLPDVLIKGGDWDMAGIVGSDMVVQNGGEVKTIPFVEGYSTSGIITKIKKTAAA